MIRYYPDFPSIEEADACSQQLYRLGRPDIIARDDVGARLFESIRLTNVDLATAESDVHQDIRYLRFSICPQRMRMTKRLIKL